MTDGLPKSRKEAKRAGLMHYCTGEPCDNGHTAHRHTSNGHCLECTRIRNGKAYQANAARDAAKRRQYRAECAEVTRATQRRARARANERIRRGELLPPRKHPDTARAWRQNNKGVVAAHSAKRRADKIQRTPAWADIEAIAAFWAACPDGHHVDHILPLRGKSICGLHVLENLQYLPSTDNIVKGNRFVPYVVFKDSYDEPMLCRL